MRFKLLDAYFKGAGQKRVSFNGQEIELTVDHYGYFELPEWPEGFPIHAIANILGDVIDVDRKNAGWGDWYWSDNGTKLIPKSY